MGLFGSIGNAVGDVVNDLTGGSLGDFIPGVGDSRAQEKANKTNLQEAKLNREFQERMSSTAYQRAMEDMRKAGLNPMLAYQQGGASVPSGAQGSVEAAPKTGLANAAMAAFTGISTARTQAQQANTAQAQAESTIALQSAQSAQQVAATEKTQAETQKTIDSIKSEKKRRELMQSQLRLEKVKSSAADLANKGVSTLEKMSDSFFRSTAKDSVLMPKKGSTSIPKYQNPYASKAAKWFSKLAVGK